ncbi:hypothetical protein T484DRAFT_1910337 [Baffinella frigidus]|nr:hypothetical protein T484DRAFT_1910337 [Cryptophyta sp. CCMP2293]
MRPLRGVFCALLVLVLYLPGASPRCNTTAPSLSILAPHPGRASTAVLNLHGLRIGVKGGEGCRGMCQVLVKLTGQRENRTVAFDPDPEEKADVLTHSMARQVACGGASEMHAPLHLAPGAYEIAARVVDAEEEEEEEAAGGEEEEEELVAVDAWAPKEEHRAAICDGGARS